MCRLESETRKFSIKRIGKDRIIIVRRSQGDVMSLNPSPEQRKTFGSGKPNFCLLRYPLVHSIKLNRFWPSLKFGTISLAIFNITWFGCFKREVLFYH